MNQTDQQADRLYQAITNPTPEIAIPELLRDQYCNSVAIMRALLETNMLQDQATLQLILDNCTTDLLGLLLEYTATAKPFEQYQCLATMLLSQTKNPIREAARSLQMAAKADNMAAIRFFVAYPVTDRDCLLAFSEVCYNGDAQVIRTFVSTIPHILTRRQVSWYEDYRITQDTRLLLNQIFDINLHACYDSHRSVSLA